jgi:hypothetical protein
VSQLLDSCLDKVFWAGSRLIDGGDSGFTTEVDEDEDKEDDDAVVNANG